MNAFWREARVKNNKARQTEKRNAFWRKNEKRENKKKKKVNAKSWCESEVERARGKFNRMKRKYEAVMFELHCAQKKHKYHENLPH